MRAATARTCFDVDGMRYLDLVLSWGPLILGHAPAAVVAAITEAALRGTSYGAPSEIELALAERIIATFPAVEMLRFVNSGTEATMSALPAGARRHRSLRDREVRRLLPRACRCAAGGGRIGVATLGAARIRRASPARRPPTPWCCATTTSRRPSSSFARKATHRGA